jgi:carboxyl-terminal processing protease
MSLTRHALISILALVLVVFSPQGLVAADKAKGKQAAEKSRFEKFELFNKVLYLIETQYYREVDTEKLIQGALNGMMNTLDPHSVFLDEDVLKKMNEDTEGKFGGLGIEVTQKDGVIVIITPIEDTPAYIAGLKPGDKIVEVNNESSIGMTLEQVVDKMRGEPGEKITLGIVREGVKGVKRYTIKREIIKTRSVKYEVIQDEYAYVKLIQFSKGVGNQMVKALKKMRKQIKRKKKDLQGIILDLRYNPGGLLDEAVEVSSVFLKDGVVVSTEGRDPKRKDIRYVKKLGYKETEIPLVVLINASSASASEIVAGALQDANRALIAGTRSFGKGTVQTIAKIDDKTGVKITIAQYMTPKGRKIQALGVKPDIKVSQSEGDWVQENVQEGSAIREEDLRNHLTATIETKEEKALRKEKEAAERKRRRQAYEDSKDNKKAKKDRGPKNDYMVFQAVNILRSFDKIQTMTK